MVSPDYFLLDRVSYLSRLVLFDLKHMLRGYKKRHAIELIMRVNGYDVYILIKLGLM